MLDTQKDDSIEVTQDDCDKIKAFLKTYAREFILGAQAGMIINNARTDTFLNLITFLENDLNIVKSIQVGEDNSIIFYGDGDTILFEGLISDFRGNGNGWVPYAHTEFPRIISRIQSKSMPLAIKIQRYIDGACNKIRSTIGL